MSKFKNNRLIEKCNQLNKAIEIVGGKEFLNTRTTDDIDMAEQQAEDYKPKLDNNLANKDINAN